MSQPNMDAEINDLDHQLVELGYSKEAINEMSPEEKLEITFDDREACSLCNGEKFTAKLEHVTGENIPAGGFYQESGEVERCPLCNAPDEDGI